MASAAARQNLPGLAAKMPKLAGFELEPPTLHAVSWRPNRIFAAEDDPDRTAMPWSPPGFVWDNPSNRAAYVKCEELQLPQYPRQGVSFARVVRNVMAEEDCASLLALVNKKGFTPALVNIGRGMQQFMPDYRDGHRVIADSPELAWWLGEVLRPHLPTKLPNGAQFVGLNERCRFLCYTPGQFFEEHCDGRYSRPVGHPREGDFSFVTVQIYLHDVPAEFGGATTFFPSGPSSLPYQPEAGSVLLFTQDLLHEGTLVTDGLKYTLRTEAMYAHGSDMLDSDATPTWPPAPARFRDIGTRTEK
mmetsp:Transcript_69559/g.166827  ORF Transcript_69559/g.166827 Transcript_69559/m.166827 type:complete len:303 (+) Transcript_69559:54-962(+)